MSSVFTLIPAPINKEITLGWKKEIFVKFLVSYILDLWPRFLVRTDNHGFSDIFPVTKNSIIFEMFVSIIVILEMFLKVDFKFQFEYFFEVLNFHCLIAGSELNNKCLPSQPGWWQWGGKSGKILFKFWQKILQFPLGRRDKRGPTIN